MAKRGPDGKWLSGNGGGHDTAGGNPSTGGSNTGESDAEQFAPGTVPAEDLVRPAAAAPKFVPVPVPGKADSDEEKRGPGRPKGSSKKGDKSDDDSLGQLITAGVQMLAGLAVQKRGAHWAPMVEKAEEIGRLASTVANKWFPASKAIKYSDEARLLFAIGQAVGPALMIEWMMAQQAKSEPRRGEEPKHADHTRRSAATQPGSGAGEDEGSAPDGGYGLRDDLAIFVS